MCQKKFQPNMIRLMLHKLSQRSTIPNCLLFKFINNQQVIFCQIYLHRNNIIFIIITMNALHVLPYGLPNQILSMRQISLY